MKKKIGCFLAVTGLFLAIGCGGDTQAGTAVTVEEIPIYAEESAEADYESGSIAQTVEETAEVGTDSGVETDEQTESVTEYQTESEKETVTEEIVVNGNEGTIHVGTIGTPYAEILTQAKLILAQEGWDVQVEVYDDYEKMNQDVVNGTLDAHLFTHQTYLDSYNDVYGTNLVAASQICYEKYGFYSLLNQDLTQIKSGVTLGIPQDDTKKARVLLLLQDMGYLTLKEGVGLTAILDDITENPKNIQFAEYTPDTIADILESTDYCIMGADQAILAGFEPQKDVIKEEVPTFESAKTMVTLLVTTEERVADEKLTLLENAIKSEVTEKYMSDTYKGAWGLFP